MPPREKENQAAPENQIQHLPVSPVRHKARRNPMVRDGDPAEPDAGPVIETGFYGVDKAAESHKVYRCDTEGD